jgi:hypothetical protein
LRLRWRAAPLLDIAGGLRYAQSVSDDGEEIVRVDVDTLKLWPGNPRRGNSEAIRESIRVNGIYKPILVWRATGQVLAGNNTLIAARELGHKQIDVIYKDVDEATARRINLVDNKAADGAEYDDELLREALGAMDGLEGTGWSAEEFDALMAVAGADDDGMQLEIEEFSLGEDVLVLEDVVTGADWAELPQQEAARGERQAAQVTSAVKGTREIMLIYSSAEHAEIIRLLDGLKSRVGEGARYPQIVAALVRRAAREAGLG